METIINKMKVSALNGMKRLYDQRRLFQEIAYGKGLATFSRMSPKANKTKDKINRMRDFIRQKH